ncbi:hypothetical protein ACP90_23655 [Labrenzia sp. CP4]|jgi:hypothetical protein|uniref:hypothetical protein n=1 Tax=Labrenzia sp. CP4 TaxID=1674922 RepID=UPI0007854EC4|nr:hypothetical protein [Labrenzia sp. CP4]AMN54892.1 hypothetical protein ACP90_23655 [Labrenzia sp. CP4]
MSYHDAPGLGRRLVRLPGQLLLALVNATALLVIAACVLSLLVLNRVDTAGERIAGNVTEAALARLQVSPGEFKARIEALDGKITTLAAQLSDPDLRDHWEVAQQLKELNRNLADIRLAAVGLSAAGPEITDTAFEQAGDMLTSALYTLRGCETALEDSEPSS